MYLFKYLPKCGICSRRNSATIIRKGKIKINDLVVLDIFYFVKHDDKVFFNNKLIKPKEYVYILLNKPNDYITTLFDPKDRRTVFDLIQDKSFDSLYSVGRLDRNTTGLLLLTNDGDLTQKLTHPSFNIKKKYKVVLNKSFIKNDFKKLKRGIYLKDGFIKVDKLFYQRDKNKKSIEVELHSGRNRIIRRIFEYLGYKVLKLDRYYFAGLTKKNLAIGKWRLLTKKEIEILKK